MPPGLESIGCGSLTVPARHLHSQALRQAATRFAYMPSVYIEIYVREINE